MNKDFRKKPFYGVVHRETGYFAFENQHPCIFYNKKVAIDYRDKIGKDNYQAIPLTITHYEAKK